MVIARCDADKAEAGISPHPVVYEIMLETCISVIRVISVILNLTLTQTRTQI